MRNNDVGSILRYNRSWVEVVFYMMDPPHLEFTAGPTDVQQKRFILLVWLCFNQQWEETQVRKTQRPKHKQTLELIYQPRWFLFYQGDNSNKIT